MRAIAALLIVALVGCLAVAGPAGAADVKIRVRTEHPANHEMILPRDDGVGNAKIFTRFGMGNFTCLQPTEMSFDLNAPFPREKAGPIQPSTIRFTIPADSATLNSYKEWAIPVDIQVEMDWYEDELPATGVEHTYVIQVGNINIPNAANCPNMPPTSGWAKETASLKVRMEDLVNETNPCEAQGLGSDCAAPTTEAAAESPALDVFGLLGICVAAAVILRRRK